MFGWCLWEIGWSIKRKGKVAGECLKQAKSDQIARKPEDNRLSSFFATVVRC